MNAPVDPNAVTPGTGSADPGQQAKTEGIVAWFREIDHRRSIFAFFAFAFVLALVGYIVWWATCTLDRPIAGYVEGGLQAAIYDWRRGIARAAVVLGVLGFCGVLLRFVEQIEIARAGKKVDSKAADLIAEMQKLVETLQKSLPKDKH